MKPISVSFECFGPYLEPQFIDFTCLENSGLFLICGDTGSGKTTILEAMCYALYGKSSGGSRGDLTAMRNKQSPTDKATSVEFIFEAKGNRYRFFRSIIPVKSRKSKQDAQEGSEASSESKYREECECQYWVDGDFLPLEDSKAKKTFMDKKAEELIGLNHAQFCQVILLPQGKFETLLVSDSVEKEKILTTLFQAQRWEKLSKKLSERASRQAEQVKKDRREIDLRLEQYSCRSLEELREKAETQKQMLKQMEDNLEAAKTAYDSKLKEWNDASQINTLFCDCDQAKKKWDKLQTSEDRYAQLEKTIQISDKAEEIAESYRAYGAALGKKQEEASKLERAKKDLGQKEQALGTLSQQWEAHKEGQTANEEDKSSKMLYEGKREIYSSLKEKKNAVSQAEALCKALKMDVDRAEVALDGAKEHLLAAIEALGHIRQEQARAYDLYLKGIGFVLAQKLEEKQPCPVCGSTDHPHPATAIEGHITDKELDSINKKLKDAISHEENCREKVKEAETAHNDAKGKHEEALRQKAAADSAYESAKEQCIPDIPDSKALEKKIQELQQKLQAYEAAERELEQALNAARSKHSAALSLFEAAKAEWDKAEKVFEKEKAKWEAARTKAGFSDDEQYLSACIDPNKKNQKRTELIGFRKDLQAARADYEEKQEALAGKERPDIAQSKALLDAAQAHREALSNACATGKKELSAISKDIDTLAVAEGAYEVSRCKAEEAMEFANRIKGTSGISLQRYVLGVMLTAITATANQILRKVCNGRYQLSRSDDASGRAHKKGLELDVYTTGNHDFRKVSTLSGGEKFLVSLCLAIGLSTVVQAQGHGVRMEAMFIDEGFGSLDKNRIQDALDVLEYIRNSSGLVGIISHIEALAESIPTKIQVTKTNQGSKCEIHL